MALQGVMGNGSKLAYSLSSPVSWTRVGQVMNIDKLMSFVRSKIDTTVYNENSDIRTTMPGMIDAPSQTVTILQDLDPATSPTQKALRDYQLAGTILWWRVEVPVNREKTSFHWQEFQAYIESWDRTMVVDDKQITTAVLSFAGNLAEALLPGASTIS